MQENKGHKAEQEAVAHDYGQGMAHHDHGVMSHDGQHGHKDMGMGTIKGDMHGQHDAHAQHGGMHMAGLKHRFFVCLALAVPVLLLSPMMGVSLPFQFTFVGSQWVVLVLASVLYFYGGLPFLQGAKEELKAKSPAMMTLISLGITVAYLYSLYVL